MTGVSNKVKKQTEKKVKTRTFLGCKTCRDRKVKCDERRPKCLKCVKSNRECQGYGFTLKFVDIFTVQDDLSFGTLKRKAGANDTQKIARQQLPFMKFSDLETFTTFKEVDAKLEQLETILVADEDVRAGPFGVIVCKNLSSQSNARSTSSIPKIPVPFLGGNTVNGSSFLQAAQPASPEKNELHVLPSISEVINLNGHHNCNTRLSRILPLVPALELHHQRKRQQYNCDLLNKYNVNRIGGSQFEMSDLTNHDSESVANPIWIHPRLEIDAMLTYQVLIGSAKVVNQSVDIIKRVIFAERYGNNDLKNQIIDKMDLSFSEIELIVESCTNVVIRTLNEGNQATVSSTSFTALLRSQRIQELIRLFVKSQPTVLHLSFNGCIFDTIVIPLLYKIIGELLVFECSVGLPGDWFGKVNENGIEFRKYCDILKRTFCMVALSITCFAQYKVLFNEYGIFDRSLRFFECYIAFREMSLANLSILIRCLIISEQKKDKENYEITNFNLIDRLVKLDLFKGLILTFILAIYQDSNIDIIHNYKLLYSILSQLREYSQSLEDTDTQMTEIWEWFRYLFAFYKSCSKIDLDSYEINEEGFEDVKEDYNLIKEFEFDDYFHQHEFNKIDIRSNVNCRTDDNMGEKFDDVDTNSSYSEDDFSSDASENDNILELPERLAKRPHVEDKPPRTITVRFHFSDENGDDETADHIKDREFENEDECNHQFESENGNDSNPSNDGNDGNDGKDFAKNGYLVKQCSLSNSNELPVNSAPAKVVNTDELKYYNSTDKPYQKRVKRVRLSIQRDRMNDENELSSVKSSVETTSGVPGVVSDCYNSKLTNKETMVKQQNYGVNMLTGLEINHSLDMTLNEREQLCFENDRVEIIHPSDIDFRNSTRRPSSIELSFGIPISLLDLIERTVKLADHKNWCLRKKIFPRNFPKICCDLEEELINWKLDWDLYSSIKTTKGDLQFHSLFHKALYHLAVSFYNSLLMYFFRLIKETNPNLLQSHVISTITHLEELKNLSLRSDFSKDMKIFPPFWCFFISGSDAVSTQLQYRFDELARKWFVAGNKWLGKQVVMEVWRSNSREVSNNDKVSWLDVLKDWEVSGFN